VGREGSGEGGHLGGRAVRREGSGEGRVGPG
jgi:hypothetical protein